MKSRVHQSPLNVPAGFAGWWCQHCDAPAPNIPDELDAAQARCPRCHKWTAVWIPPTEAVDGGVHRDTRGACAPQRRPCGERAKALFDHIRACMEDPTLPADLAEHDYNQTIR